MVTGMAGVAGMSGVVTRSGDRGRFTKLAGAHNFRDLGGYPTADGRRTRWGRLYRSDALHNLTPDDVAVVRSMGLRTVVDLRTPAEADRLGRGPLADGPIRYHNASLSRDGMAPMTPDGDLVGRYLSYLDEGAGAFVTVFAEMARADNLPMLLHCMFGKDRTGVLVAVVLESMGVQRRHIVDDFALSSEPVRRIMDGLREDPEYRETIDRTPPERLLAPARTMERFLDQLDERHGGARAWLGRVGVPAAHLEAAAAHLLE
jgi:protein-tyrosine phosphatase